MDWAQFQRAAAIIDAAPELGRLEIVKRANGKTAPNCAVGWLGHDCVPVPETLMGFGVGDYCAYAWGEIKARFGLGDPALMETAFTNDRTSVIARKGAVIAHLLSCVEWPASKDMPPLRPRIKKKVAGPLAMGINTLWQKIIAQDARGPGG
jgi:hypothetical protein